MTNHTPIEVSHEVEPRSLVIEHYGSGSTISHPMKQIGPGKGPIPIYKTELSQNSIKNIATREVEGE